MSKKTVTKMMSRAGGDGAESAAGGRVRRILAILLCTSLMGAATLPNASADEGGVPFWFSGQYASLSAVPPQPGWTMTLLPYYYNGSASRSKTFQRAGRTLSAGLDTSAALMIAQPSYAPHTAILGGQPSFGLGFGFGGNWTSASATLGGLSGSRSDSAGGALDLYPIVSNSWASGHHNWMAYVTGDIPVGAYESNRLSNLGLGHGAIDAGGGYTYLNGENGREFTVVAGFTYNFENPTTNYQSGIDSHLDWAASQFLSENWEVGVAGYAYDQLTGDSGSGDLVGSFESGVAAVGPEVGYVFNVGQHQWYANLRGYYEFWAQNRVQGYDLFLTLSMPFGD